MQGTSLTKQERECKLYDEFDKFAYKKRESLREFYLRFSLLLNDMNIYNIKLEQFQVNTKFFNTLPPEWSKFVTDVKLIGDDPIDAINHMMSFLTVVVTSRYPSTNNQLRNLSNPRQQATINNGRVTVQPIQGRHTFLAAGTSKTYTSGIALMVNLSHYGSDDLAEYVSKSQYVAVQNSNIPAQQDALILSVIEQLKTQVVNCTKINLDNKGVNQILIAELERYKDQTELSADQVFWSHNSMNSEEPNLSTRPTHVEVPKELPKVNMVNKSLKKRKHDLASFDVAVEQHRVESKGFHLKMNKVLNKNERLLEKAISKDVMNIVLNATVNNAYEHVHEYERCVKLETELQ
nr:hypothetical protein [Tanacetum cinerariifolium]